MKKNFLNVLILASFTLCYCGQQQEMQGSIKQLVINKGHAEKLKTLLAEIENIKKEAETKGITCKHWEDFINILKSEHEYYVKELKKAMEAVQNKPVDAHDIESDRHEIDDMRKNLEGLYELPQFKTLVVLLAALQDQFSEEILELIEKGSTGKIDSATLASWQKKYAFDLNGIKGLKETIDNERKKIAAADILSKKQEEQESVGKTTGQEDLQKEYAKKLDKLLEQIKMIKAEAEASGIVLQHWDDFIKILKTQHENYVDALKGAIKLAQNKFAAQDFLKTYRDDISDMKKNLEGLYELPQFKTLVGVLAGVQEKFSKEILAMIAKGSTGKIPSTLLDTWKKKYAFTKGGIEDLIKRIDALRKEIATRSTSDFLSQIKAGKQLRPVNAPAETVISTPIPAPVAPVQVPQEKPSPKKTPEIKEPVELPQSGALINTSSKTLYYCVGTQREMDLVRKSTESLSKAFKPLYPKAVVSLKFDIDAPPHIYLTDKDLAVKGTPAAPINPVLKPTDQINVFYSIQPGVNMYVQADSSVISGLSVKPVDNGKMVGSMQVSNNITSKQLIKEKIKVQDLIK